VVLDHGSWFERYTEACRHVLEGKRAVQKQRELIAKDKAQGRDTKSYEDQLASFERAQIIFEDDLKRIKREFGLS
jgi:hypothetical protein